ncbi:nucleotidyltransferase family protein [Candidatus Sumerlaeota bacterium]|nr:nucleotidyltransferase family protein [Candidatus Sumerlaeota bacterium]
MLAHWPPEVRLACLLCRRSLSPQQWEMARELAGAGLDWNYFLRFVEAQKVLPIVSHHACQSLTEMMPPRVCDELRVRAIGYRKRAEAMADELAAILTVLEDAAIVAVPLKGLTLVERIWGDWRLAACDDLDVLVRPNDTQTATETLARCGYRADSKCADGVPRWKLGSDSLWLVRAHGQLPFLIWVDLQTNWWQRRINRSVRTDHLWGQLVGGRFRGANVWYLPDAWNLLTIGLHSLGHLFDSLLCVAELHGLHEVAQEAWPEALRLAGQLGVRPELLLAKEVCDLIMGEHVVERHTVRPLARCLADGPLLVPNSIIARHRLALASRLTIRSKIVYLLTGAFRPQPTDEALIALPPRMRFLYYAIRPIRLAVRYFIHACRGGDTQALRPRD